jgi:4-aminobutyrate--pyruvate transaminase
MHKPNSPAARDIAVNLHPYTDARRHELRGPLLIERGEGIYVYDGDGREYIEGLSGLWSVALGFSEKRLVRAATEQMERLPFYHSFAHKGHLPAVDLSERLLALAPAPMSKVFYANSGSEAADTAVKIVWYYNNAIGRPQKKKIISRVRAYHGVTVAAASLTGTPWNHADFDLPMGPFLHATCPHHYRYAEDGEDEESFASRLANELERIILEAGPETVAAFVGEPVMGAGGVIVPPRTYWEKIQNICRKYDVLIIADEVINGFGRTGQMFGSHVFGIKPDVMLLSKQLTSSYFPLSAVLVSDVIYQGIADNSAKLRNFAHGFTTSAHPVAMAVALESLQLFEERNLVRHVAEVGPALQDGLRRFASHPHVGEVRGIGLIGAIELVADKATKAPFISPGEVGSYLADKAAEHGLIIRNIGDTIAFCPPLIITASEIDEMLRRFDLSLEATLDFIRDRSPEGAVQKEVA